MNSSCSETMFLSHNMVIFCVGVIQSEMSMQGNVDAGVSEDGLECLGNIRGVWHANVRPCNVFKNMGLCPKPQYRELLSKV